MKPYRYIENDTQWEAFRKEYLLDMDGFPSIDFDTKSLYVVVNRGVKGLVRSFDIKELTYNEETFTVIITKEDSTIIDEVHEKEAYWINIVEINKADFSKKERDWLMVPEKKE